MEPARQLLSVQVMLRDDSHAESWRRVLEHLKTSTATYWLATCGAHGTPHGYDLLVVGLGSMGAAAARTLAARGLRVLEPEIFGAAHDHGSAHGGTRIVRQSYFKGSA